MPIGDQVPRARFGIVDVVLVECQVGRVCEPACRPDQFGVQALGVMVGALRPLPVFAVLLAKLLDVIAWKRLRFLKLSRFVDRLVTWQVFVHQVVGTVFG